MITNESRPGMRAATPFVLLASMFVAAGGFIHLHEWLEIYRQVPASVPGANLVRVGFPLNAAASLAIAAAIVLVHWRRSRRAFLVIAAGLVFQAASLATLIATRTGSVLGWSESTWTPGADQTRAVEIAALLALVAVAALTRRERGIDRSRPPSEHSDSHPRAPAPRRRRPVVADIAAGVQPMSNMS